MYDCFCGGCGTMFDFDEMANSFVEDADGDMLVECPECGSCDIASGDEQE